MRMKITQEALEPLVKAICEMCRSITFPKVEISDRTTITVTSTMQQIPGAPDSPRSYRNVCMECADEFRAEKRKRKLEK